MQSVRLNKIICQSLCKYRPPILSHNGFHIKTFTIGINKPCFIHRSFSNGKYIVKHKLQDQSNNSVRLSQKIKDSILVLEARHGPFGKTVAGLCQCALTAGLVYGSGALLYGGLIVPIMVSDNSNPQEGSEKESVPEYAKQRVTTAYMYLANSLGVTAAAAVVSFKLFNNLRFLNIVAANPVIALCVAMGSQMAASMLVRSIPYREGFGPKQVGSIFQATMMGLCAAPLYLVGAQSIIRSGFVTAGAMMGLSGLSAMFPKDAFVNWEAPLRIGMYGVFLAFLGLWFVPRSAYWYNSLYRVAMHGGLVVFPGYYLYHTKALVRDATNSAHFDPINSSMGLYTDVLNIYGRLAFLLPPHYLMFGDAKHLRLNWGKNKDGQQPD